MHVLAVAAEFERSVIRERINAGLARGEGTRRETWPSAQASPPPQCGGQPHAACTIGPDDRRRIEYPDRFGIRRDAAARRDGKTWSTTKAARKGE